MKYISFSPYSAGLCNVVLSFEVAIALSITLKRKLIIPPKLRVWTPCSQICDHEFVDTYRIFEKEILYDNLDCIDFYDVPEFKGHYDKMKSERSFTENISEVIPSTNEIFFGPYLDDRNSPTLLIENDSVICGKKSFGLDFKRFVNGRKVINLSDDRSKFIHFENNLFSLHWYSIYPGEEKERNNVKKVINKCISYNSNYLEISKKVYNQIGKYNSLHLRRNDFITFSKDYQSTIDNKSKLLERVKMFYNNDIPLYISTDENDKSFFDEVSKYYTVYFYEDFDYDLNEIDKAIVEQLICSNSEYFYGTYLSTYSSRINIIRGINGKQSEDHLKINLDMNNNYNIDKPIHWYWNNKNSKLNWAESSHPHWKYEKNGVYVK